MCLISLKLFKGWSNGGVVLGLSVGAWWRVGIESLVVAAPMQVQDRVLVLVVLADRAAPTVVLKVAGCDEAELRDEVHKIGALSEPGNGLCLDPCLNVVPSLRWSCRTA